MRKTGTGKVLGPINSLPRYINMTVIKAPLNISYTSLHGLRESSDL